MNGTPDERCDAVAGPVDRPVRPLGWDSRKWRPVKTAAPCKHCGAVPIAARSVSGWSLACPNDKAHGRLFEQWMQKCKRRWAALHAA